MKLYYADAQNQTAGPATLEELKALMKAGVLPADPLVIEEGGAEWKRLSSFPMSGIGAPLPPPPPPPPAQSQSTAPASGKIHPAVYVVAVVVLVVLIAVIGKGKNGKTSDGQNVSSSQMAERNPPDQMPWLTESKKREMEVTVQNKMMSDLRQIDAALNQFALEKGKSTGDPVTWDQISPYINLAGLNYTPNNYIVSRIGENPRSVKYGDLLMR
jgi:hypothetical protein